jgi:hypothetical protein
VLTVSRIYPDPKTGKFDLLGTKGNKIDVELAPMAEGKLEAGEIPGSDRAGTVAADGWVYHPSGRWAAEIVRMLGGAVLHNLTSDAAEYAPISFLSFNSDTPGQARFCLVYLFGSAGASRVCVPALKSLAFVWYKVVRRQTRALD